MLPWRGMRVATGKFDGKFGVQTQRNGAVLKWKTTVLQLQEDQICAKVIRVIWSPSLPSHSAWNLLRPNREVMGHFSLQPKLGKEIKATAISMDRVLFKAPLNLPCSARRWVIPLGMSAGISWDFSRHTKDTPRTHNFRPNTGSFLWENEQGTNEKNTTSSQCWTFIATLCRWECLGKNVHRLGIPNSSSLTMNTANIWSWNLVLMWNNLRCLDINSRLLLVIKKYLTYVAFLQSAISGYRFTWPAWFPCRSARLAKWCGAHAWSLARWHNLGASQLGSLKRPNSIMMLEIPSGELTFCHGKSPFLMGKSTKMAIFNCYVSSPEGIWLRLTENLGVQKYFECIVGVKGIALASICPSQNIRKKKQQTSFWVNYNISLTWIKAIWGSFPLLTMITVRSQWGRYNLPRSLFKTLAIQGRPCLQSGKWSSRSSPHEPGWYSHPLAQKMSGRTFDHRNPPQWSWYVLVWTTKINSITPADPSSRICASISWVSWKYTY